MTLCLPFGHVELLKHPETACNRKYRQFLIDLVVQNIFWDLLVSEIDVNQDFSKEIRRNSRLRSQVQTIFGWTESGPDLGSEGDFFGFPYFFKIFLSTLSISGIRRPQKKFCSIKSIRICLYFRLHAIPGRFDASRRLKSLPKISWQAKCHRLLPLKKNVAIYIVLWRQLSWRV